MGGKNMATVMFKGNPVTLLGNEVKVGQAAPDFKVQKSADMNDYTLASTPGKTRIVATVPSLDTPVCDMETKRFNDEASKLPNVEIVCISMDLPFAQKRWCGAANIESTHHSSYRMRHSDGLKKSGLGSPCQAF
jgi:thioredoxin-dependent peroxiredoxin